MINRQRQATLAQDDLANNYAGKGSSFEITVTTKRV